LKTLTKNPIDVVIAWVDGEDPNHRKKRLRFLNKNKLENLPGADETRFHSLNEVKYCVLSILKFAAFVRNIFIVTDKQVPDVENAVKSFFPERLKDIRIVDHTEIFEGYEKFLPTFNSICISNMLWRIKGLSKQFVYFNDDIFLVRPITPNDWFRNDRPVLRGKWFFPPYERLIFDSIKRFFLEIRRTKNKIELPASFQVNQWTAAALLGFSFRYFKSGHTPLAMDKSRLETFFNSHPDILKNNISHRFRNYYQFNTVSLANHLEIKSGNTNFASSQVVYMQPHNRGKLYVDKKFNLCKENPDNLFLCVQSLDQATSSDQKKVINQMESILNILNE
jgi:hypothetical protein